MLDSNFIRNNSEEVKNGANLKGFDAGIVDRFLEADVNWREKTKEIEGLRAEKNKLGRDDRDKSLDIKDKEKSVNEKLKELESLRLELLLQIPNLPSEDTPKGKGEGDNVVLREVGKRPKFNFEPKDHVELATALDIIDFETGSKVSGSGFYYLKGDGVMLELGLVRYALDFLSKRGFTPWITPDLARGKFYLGTGYMPRGDEAQTYIVENTDLGLIATAEVTLAGIHADETLDGSNLPKWYSGYSHCFRQEAGAYGKYSKGLYRVHQFTKVEMFVYCKPEDSNEIHDKLLEIEEELWQSLGIPYRVLQMCTGDLGAMASRKFDLDAWMPGRGDWGEVTSASNTTDYQARRLGIKFRREDGETHFAHTLNGTAIATSRAIIAILENNQTKDGAIIVPKVLRDYVGKKEIKKPSDL